MPRSGQVGAIGPEPRALDQARALGEEDEDPVADEEYAVLVDRVGEEPEQEAGGDEGVEGLEEGGTVGAGEHQGEERHGQQHEQLLDVHSLQNPGFEFLVVIEEHASLLLHVCVSSSSWEESGEVDGAVGD